MPWDTSLVARQPRSLTHSSAPFRRETCGIPQGTASTDKKTAVLIAADVDSLSGKARKARQYGIPIIEEDVLEAALAAAT